jgi:TnpA family transposase
MCGFPRANETELPIVEHTTDTAGFTEIVFALFDLLGLQFAPRIRDLGEQRLYRMDRAKTYQHIEPLLKGTIDQDLITSAWDDLPLDQQPRRPLRQPSVLKA